MKERFIMELGAKIKELRQSRGMTQEQVAQKLNVSNQTVSKWETGAACPDLSLIVPIARLFGVTTDELFDFSATTDKLRLEELQKQYDETFKTGNLHDRLEISKQAVKEFPSDMKWLNDYGWDIWCDAVDLKGEEFAVAREKAINIFKTVIDQTDVDEIKCNSIVGICQCLCGAGRKAEALEYVDKFPDIKPMMKKKQEIYLNCLDGKEQKRGKQLYIYDMLSNLLRYLCWQYNFDEDQPVLIDTAISLTKLFFPDGNYLDEAYGLAHLYIRKAKHCADDGKADEAEVCFKEAFKCAHEFDGINGKYSYTAPLFNLVSFDRNNAAVTGQTTLTEDLRNMLELPYYAVLKNLDAYKEMCEKE